MKVIIGLVIAGLLSPPAMSEKAELQVLQGNGEFTNKLYQVLSGKEGNVFFSPISAHAVLSMAYQGAQGTTATHFAATLNVPEARSAADGYKEIITRLNSVQNVTLLMANKVYLNEGSKLLENFKTSVTKSFLSDVQLLNFGQSEAAAKAINGWVEVQTHDKIKDLIKKDDLNALTRLVLVNAIYFKGNWLHKFNKDATKSEPFYLNENDTVDVQMMHIKKKFHYKDDKDLDAQVLELPYINEDLSMIIILPNEKNGIKALEEKLATVNISDITNQMWKTDVNVALPKFKIEQTIDLKDALTKLGLGEIFDEDKANFRGMIELQPNENLFVSKVVQKAFIEVNEEGAEAAAATGAIWASRVARLEFRFKVDHPFIFQIVHNCNHHLNAPLFQGRVNKP